MANCIHHGQVKKKKRRKPKVCSSRKAKGNYRRHGSVALGTQSRNAQNRADSERTAKFYGPAWGKVGVGAQTGEDVPARVGGHGRKQGGRASGIGDRKSYHLASTTTMC